MHKFKRPILALAIVALQLMEEFQVISMSDECEVLELKDYISKLTNS